MNETHTITFARTMDRALQAKSYRRSVDSLIDSIATKSRTTKGWSFEENINGLIEDNEYHEDGHRYSWTLNVAFNHPSNTPDRYELDSIAFTLYGRAMTPAFGRWTLASVDGKPYDPPSEDDANITTKEDIGYADCSIPGNWDEHFEHLYGLDAQIRRVKNAITAAITSKFRNRFNVVLVGPPGCGKSDIALSMKAALGDDAVWSFDATAITAAGLIKRFDTADILPRIVVFEEVEKASKDALQPLLGILDQRGEVRKTTARGDVQRDTRCLTICTVNNYELFQSMQAGALHSRHPNRVFFKRPSRTTLSMILHREVAKVDGDVEWVKPALDFCEANGIDDPREVIAHCLCGGDGLLDGSYQADMAATAEPKSDHEHAE
jgi:hypothetical protein